MSETVHHDASVDEALTAFRGNADDDEERHIVLGYEGKNKLVVVEGGPGGSIDDVRHLLPADACRYVLLRIRHQVEMASTWKFAYIDWTPDTLKPMRKALLSTHKGQVEDYLKPFHVSLKAGDETDLVQQTVMDKIGFSSGTASHVRAFDANRVTATRLHATRATPVVKKELVPSSSLASRQLDIEDEEAVQAAIAAVRDDSDPTEWMSIMYANGGTKALCLSGSGSGGLAELKESLTNDSTSYSLFRVTEVVDQSVVVRFGMLRLLSTKLSPVAKAQISTHLGFVSGLLDPYHVEFKLDHKDEFSEELVVKRVRDVMGLSDKIRSKEQKAQSTPQAQREAEAAKKHGPVAGSLGGEVDVADPAALQAAIQAVRSDADADVTWMVAHYDQGAVVVSATGGGTYENIKEYLIGGTVSFALLREVERIDKSDTIKFVYITHQPLDIRPMLRAEIGTKKGAIDALFHPYHLDIFITNADELSAQMITDKIGEMSGTKSRVVAKDE